MNRLKMAVVPTLFLIVIIATTGLYSSIRNQAVRDRIDSIPKVVTIEDQEEIQVNVGDIIQTKFFTTPIIPEFLDAEQDIKLTGDRVCELIGTNKMEGKIGHTLHCAFFLVRNPGKTELKSTLLQVEVKEGEVSDYQPGLAPAHVTKVRTPVKSKTLTIRTRNETP